MPNLESLGVLFFVRAGNGRPHIGPTLVSSPGPRALFSNARRCEVVTFAEEKT